MVIRIFVSLLYFFHCSLFKLLSEIFEIPIHSPLNIFNFSFD